MNPPAKSAPEVRPEDLADLLEIGRELPRLVRALPQVHFPGEAPPRTGWESTALNNLVAALETEGKAASTEIKKPNAGPAPSAGEQIRPASASTGNAPEPAPENRTSEPPTRDSREASAIVPGDRPVPKPAATPSPATPSPEASQVTGISKQQWNQKERWVGDCRICPGRLSYKPNYAAGSLPVAVLHLQRERYDWRQYYPDPRADDYFRRLLTKIGGFDPADLHHIDIAACNFGPPPLDEAGNPREDPGRDAVPACAPHWQRYLREKQIQAVIVMSEAAAPLLGDQQARTLLGQWRGDLLRLTTGSEQAGETVGGIVLRSPAALVWADVHNRSDARRKLSHEMKTCLEAFLAGYRAGPGA